MNEYISKELALWLKERGCEVEAERFYCDNSCPQKLIHPRPCYGGYIPAYSWFDILVTHVDDFFDENWRNTTDGGRILGLLQLNRQKEAEDYVREYSLFSKDK